MPIYNGRKISRQRLYQIKHPERRRANQAVRYALETGKLIRPDTCEKCGKACKPDAHHDDYSKPLEVLWLCPGMGGCHRKRDQQRKRGPECKNCGRGVTSNGNITLRLCSSCCYKLRRYGDSQYTTNKEPKLCKCGKFARIRGRCLTCAYREDKKYRTSVLKKQAKYRRKKGLKSVP